MFKVRTSKIVLKKQHTFKVLKTMRNVEEECNTFNVQNSTYLCLQTLRM